MLSFSAFKNATGNFSITQILASYIENQYVYAYSKLFVTSVASIRSSSKCESKCLDFLVFNTNTKIHLCRLIDSIKLI